MTDRPVPPQGMAFDLHVDVPLILKARPTGEIEVHCYQAIAGSTEPLLMKLVFSREASGQLVATIRHAVEKGLIVLEGSSGSEMQ